MTYKQSEGLRDREYNKFTSVDTGSFSGVVMVLHATVSGTTSIVPILCDANGIILTSEIA